jgi:RNA recognition motif-containing protein
MNIYVGNLSLDITEEELRQEFVIFGNVTSVVFMHDHDIGSGQGRNIGYVEMPSLKEGESAIERLHGKSIKGQPIDVIKALPITRGFSVEDGVSIKALGFSRKSKNPGRKNNLV